MAGYPDDYIGDNPFGCLGNFPYYIPFPTGVGADIPIGGWSKERVALFGCLGAIRRLTSLLDSVRPHAPPCLRTGDYIVNGDKGTKYSRKANFTCLLE